MRARPSILVVLAAIGLVACGGPPSAGRPRAVVTAETLLLETSDGPFTVEVPSGSLVVDGTGAVASADGARIYRAAVSSGRTTVSTLNAATGEELSALRVRGRLGVRVASATGRALALMRPFAPGYDAWTPEARRRSTIVVADPTGSSHAVRYDLAGNYEPEAFSADASRLFLIQYLPAASPSVYRVTVLDLTTGEVEPAIGPLKAPAERMPGTRLEQVPAQDGSKLFTLYTSDRPGFAPHDAPVPRNAETSFVHVLSLTDGWAHCVGLPKAVWGQPASAEAMTISPDGSTLYIVDARKELVVTIDTESLDVSRPRRVDLPAPGSGTTAVMSADGSTLFVGTAGGDGAVTAIDTTSLAPIETWTAVGVITALGLSRDGKRLYVALGDRLSVLDATSGRLLGSIAVPRHSPVAKIGAIAG